MGGKEGRGEALFLQQGQGFPYNPGFLVPGGPFLQLIAYITAADDGEIGGKTEVGYDFLYKGLRLAGCHGQGMAAVHSLL